MDADRSWLAGVDASGVLEPLAGRSRLALGVALLACGVLVAEGLLFADRLWPAIWVHLATLLGCILWLQLARGTPVVAVLALVPLFRLVNLGMPVFFQLTAYWLPLVYGPLIPALVYVDRFESTAPVHFEVRQGLLYAPVAVAAGASLAAVEWVILRPDALVPTWSLAQLLMITVVMVCFVGFVEEYLFRGLIQGTTEREFGRLTGIALASVLFGAMHSGYGVPAELLFAAGVGLVFGLMYDYTENLTFVTLVHGFLNVFLFAVYPTFGLPVG